MEISDESEIDMFLSQTSDEFSIDEYVSDEDQNERIFNTSSWIKDISNINVREFDGTNVGSMHNLPDDASPLDYFKLFWDDEIMSLIVTETNRYVYIPF